MPDDSERCEQVDVVVVGAGLAGLAAVATAAGEGARAVLLEAHRFGGRARSDERSGFTFNRGPHALYLGGPAEAVLTELGVTIDGVAPPLAGGTGRRDGTLHALPSTPGSLLRSTLLRPAEKVAYARAFVRLPKLDPAEWRGRSVRDLVAALRLGGTVAEVFEAMVRLSTYVDDPEVLDAGAALANLQAAISPGVRYLHGGWQSLVDQLTAVAQGRGAELRPGVSVRSIEPHGGRVRVRTAGATFDAQTVVVAAGTPDAAAAILGQRPASWARLGPPVTAACLDLGLRRPPATRFVLGIDEPLYLSTHDPAARLAPGSQSVVHVMRYQAPGDEMSAVEQETILRGLAAAAGVEPADIVEERFLARMTVMGGRPTAAGGGLPGRPPVEVAELEGVLVAGDWVGARGMLADAALASGQAAGRLAATRAAKISVG
ncbi:MAG: Dehydrogenase [Acidimicrobiales bacterium]|nr:Dehydrogenase [Acidimicrobiales bacterium]